MSKKKSKMPKEVYLYKDHEGTDDEFLLVGKTVEEVAEIGEKRKVGKYVLVKEEIVCVKIKLLSDF